METVKEIILVTLFVVLLVGGIFFGVKYMSNVNLKPSEVMTGENIASELNSKNNEKLNKYIEKYGDTTMGYVAYGLNRFKFYSIPICIVIFLIGAFLYYIVGQEKFVEGERGYGMIVASIFFFAIAQIAPLIFALISTFGSK